MAERRSEKFKKRTQRQRYLAHTAGHSIQKYDSQYHLQWQSVDQQRSRNIRIVTGTLRKGGGHSIQKKKRWLIPLPNPNASSTNEAAYSSNRTKTGKHTEQTRFQKSNKNLAHGQKNIKIMLIIDCLSLVFLLSPTGTGPRIDFTRDAST